MTGENPRRAAELHVWGFQKVILTLSITRRQSIYLGKRFNTRDRADGGR